MLGWGEGLKPRRSFVAPTDDRTARKDAAMRRALCVVLLCVLAPSMGAAAKVSSAQTRRLQIAMPWSAEDCEGPGTPQPARALSEQVDTFTIVRYDFEVMSWQGWTRFDNTANAATEYDHCMVAAPGSPRGPGPYGMYSGLAYNLVDKDPCGMSFGTQVVFFVGSPVPSQSYPGLYDTPFCTGPGGFSAPCQDEMVISPPIDIRRYSTAANATQDALIPPGDLPLLGGCRLQFTVYADLPLANLVFYQWHVRNIVGGCAGGWRDRNYVYYGAGPEYRYVAEEIGDLVGSDSIQVALAVIDMCDEWYITYGDCAAHTPAPWFDNVSVQRYKTVGPQWSYRDLDLFQDNFPTGTLDGFVRADAALDINPKGDPAIRPGDSIVVSCASPLGGGIRVNAGGPEVYMHVRCRSLHDWLEKPNLFGADMQGTYGHYVSDDGSWTIIQCEPARGPGGGTAPDTYAFDLNDSLFTYSYMIEYYFVAFDNTGTSSALPRGADHFTSESPFFGGSYYFEFTCLPTAGPNDSGYGTLYVDDCDGRGSFDGVPQNYFDRAVKDIWPVDYLGWWDRYDVKAPSSLASNGLASRVSAAFLDTLYSVIVWDSGDLENGTITDGAAGSGDKTNDCRLLVDFLAGKLGGFRPGIWILGDNVAEDLSRLPSPEAHELLENWGGVSLAHGSYFEMTGELAGGVVNPQLMAVEGAVLYPNDCCLFGGCPGISDFDVLEAAGNGQCALTYPDYGGEQHCAAVQCANTNARGQEVRSMWFAFSFMSVRDCQWASPPVRNSIMYRIMRGWLWGGMGPVDPVTGTDAPAASALSQNFPNPFNPRTTIRYDMKEKGLVTVKVFNVAGQLVRTLVSEMKEPGSYTAVWDGKNNFGADAASGIYFCKMETAGFSATKKMVLLR